MPRGKNYTRGQIEEARRLRRYGYSWSEIAPLVNMKMSSVIAYTRDIEPQSNYIEYRTIKDIIAVLTPGEPFVELPLPSGLLALWEEKIQKPSEYEKE